jgi:hypothetical protein
MQKYREIWCHGCGLCLAVLIRAGDVPRIRYPSALGYRPAGTDESRKAEHIRGTRNRRAAFMFRCG